MGLFDAVRSLFGGETRDAEAESDASTTADETTSDEAESRSGETERTAAEDERGVEWDPSVDDGPAAQGDAARDSQESSPDRADSQIQEIEGEAASADDISEWTFDAEQSPESGEGSEAPAETTADEDDDEDAEPVSWDETGFEQLTTELVGDEAESDESDDPAELITEAEPDRPDDGQQSTAGSAEADDHTREDEARASAETDDGERKQTTEPAEAATDTVDQQTATEAADTVDQQMTAESGGRQAADSEEAAADTEGREAATASDASPAGGDDGETHLPLDEGVEEAADDSGGDVDIPEDSPRADFVSEAVDLAEFWAEYDLDFTVASLERLDEMIDDQWDPERFADAEFGGEGYDSEVFTEQVRAIGSYLGEIFVRSHGGEWVRQDEVGWTVDVPAGPNVVAAGATVTVFHIAQSALLGEASIAAKHDGVVEQLDLDERVGVEDAAATLQQAGGGHAPQSTDEDVVERFRAGAEDLAERWPDYDLDFSTASLSRLEDLLAEQLDAERFEDVELGDETDRDSLLLTAHAVGVGGYLAEVLRREHDAEWITDGRLVVVVETDDERHEVDPIDVAVDSIRGERSLTDAVPA